MFELRGKKMCFLTFRYLSNENLCVQMEVEGGHKYAGISCNTDTVFDEDVFVGKHWSENEGLLEDLEMDGLIEKTGQEIKLEGYIPKAWVYRLTAEGQKHVV